MAIHSAYVAVDFLDSAERINTRRYLLRQTYDDVANDFDDVQTAADALITALDVMTWDHIDGHRIEIFYSDSGASANIAANNQVEAFTRVMDSDGNKSYVQVPAWDDATYDQDSNNLLSAAYNTAMATVVALLRDPVSLLDLSGGIAFSQSRTRKQAKTIN